jgi:hypothetical protein
VFTIVGGRLFDDWGPWAPFVIAGAYQAALLVAAIVIRVVRPGHLREPRRYHKVLTAT